LSAALALAAVGALGCSAPKDAAAPAPVAIAVASEGADTRVTLRATPGYKINARLAPALELTSGDLLRFGAARLTPDSAYFAEPPSAVLPGRHEAVHGTLRASVCREDERLCRAVKLEI
jgi:hypothetical protein